MNEYRLALYVYEDDKIVKRLIEVNSDCSDWVHYPELEIVRDVTWKTIHNNIDAIMECMNIICDSCVRLPFQASSDDLVHIEKLVGQQWISMNLLRDIELLEAI